MPNIGSISLSICGELIYPKLDPSSRERAPRLTVVTMPEATMYKNSGTPTRKYEIRLSG